MQHTSTMQRSGRLDDRGDRELSFSEGPRSLAGDSEGAFQEYGNLELVLRHAKDLKDVEKLGKQDPYCMITVGTVTQRSREHTDGARNPVWNQDFSFPRVKREEVLFIQVMDSNVVTADEMIGEVWFHLHDLIVDEHLNTTSADLQVIRVLPVKRNGKKHGELYISLSMAPCPDEAEAAGPWQNDALPPVVVYVVAGLVAIVLLRTLSWKSLLFLACCVFLYLVPVPQHLRHPLQER